jgi:signal transduction histidine kinase
MASATPETLEQQLHRRERELAAIRRITVALHARTKPDELVRQTLDAAVETVDAAGGTMYIHEPSRNKLVFQYVLGERADELTGLEIDAGIGIVGQVFASGEGQITPDATTDAAHFRGIDEQTKYQTRNIVTVPLMTTDGRAIGAMQVLNKRHGAFDEQDLHVLQVLSAQAASAIETARLHEQAKLAEVINLIGDISHDVKNMVTPVVTGAQTLEFMVEQMWTDLDATLSEPAEPDRWADRIRQAVQSVRLFFPEAMEMTYEGASATQERVREIADAIKGIIAEPHFEPARINEIVEAVAKTLTIVAARGDVTLDLTGLADVPPADLDRKHMYNAVYNLINNALPETPRGGRISVHTSALSLDGSGTPDTLQLIVADTGRGMPEHVKARLFTDQAVSTKVGGTGLGTRIIKNVVDAHGGTITVDSEEGRGTTFTIRLPLQQPKEQPGRPEGE